MTHELETFKFLAQLKLQGQRLNNRDEVIEIREMLTTIRDSYERP